MYPRKRFSQNFLHNPGSIAQIIAAVAPTPNQRLVEIGPGLGAITMGLLQAVGNLDVIELDRNLLDPLAERCASLGSLRIHNADALKFDFCALWQTQNLANVSTLPETKFRIVGNLPYNISTPLLFHLLDQVDCINDLHLLLQKEVVARMVAAPGSKVYGRLSVMVQLVCTVQRLFDIGPGAFYPIPKVESSFVRLRPYLKIPYTITNPKALAFLVTQAFSQRRKTLRNAIRSLMPESAICACGLDGSLRPEQLGVADFVNLANMYSTLDP